MKNIILASHSPRRCELLAGLGLPFEVRVIPGIEEGYPAGLTMEATARYIAREKAAPYVVGADEVVLTADTIVVVDGQILGKPADEADACGMLRKLSGRTHEVITGVCLKTDSAAQDFAVTTEVTFKKLTDEEIDYYVYHYHPLDKAGAYGIQEWIGFIGCTGLRGSYYNVMGLPVQRVYEALRNMI